MTLPAVQLEEGGTLNLTGELWVAPDADAVVRYYATLDVTNARIRLGFHFRDAMDDGRSIGRRVADEVVDNWFEADH